MNNIDLFSDENEIKNFSLTIKDRKKPNYHEEKNLNKLMRHTKNITGTIYCSFQKEIYNILDKEVILKDINKRMSGSWFKKCIEDTVVEEGLNNE